MCMNKTKFQKNNEPSLVMHLDFFSVDQSLFNLFYDKIKGHKNQ